MTHRATIIGSLAAVLACSTAAAQRPRPATKPAADKPAPAANDPLRQGLSDMAKNVRAFLKGRDENGIAVGQFTGPPNFPSSGGPGIAKALSDELQLAQVPVKTRANLGLSGTYRPIEEKKGIGVKGSGVVVKGFDFEVAALLIRAQVEDVTGKRVAEFEQKIDDPVTISKIMGLTFDAPPGLIGPPVREAIKEPKAFVEGSMIRAAATSPFGIEVLVRKPGAKKSVPATASLEDGLAFVPIERDDVYEVRLTNGADHEAGVSLSIDGLSMFAFSENKTARFMIVPAGKSVTVAGWHRNTREVNEFVITSYAKGAVAELGANPAGVGVINATFHASWPKGGSPPPDEPGQNVIAGGGAIPAGGKSTGKGKVVESVSMSVPRDAGVMRASVSVRYEK